MMDEDMLPVTVVNVNLTKVIFLCVVFYFQILAAIAIQKMLLSNNRENVKKFALISPFASRLRMEFGRRYNGDHHNNNNNNWRLDLL
jgi:hypothetical protein